MRGATPSSTVIPSKTSISIHAPHAGRDGGVPAPSPDPVPFQSTRPMRGATPCPCSSWTLSCISIHAPHAGRDRVVLARQIPRVVISIHAPHAGRDDLDALGNFYNGPFQSTRPMRGATLILPSLSAAARISIHAPHAGRDERREPNNPHHRHFNPRAPCGARRSRQRQSSARARFQSTRPMRGATASRPPPGRTTENFNPRAPCGARLYLTSKYLAARRFQSTRPMRGATGTPEPPERDEEISIHAPHAGRDGKTAQFSCAVLRKSNNKYNAADNLQAKYACGIVQTTRAYPYFRCEAPGKSLSACASHSDHQHALRLIAGP